MSDLYNKYHRLDQIDLARYSADRAILVAFAIYSIIVIGYYGLMLVLRVLEGLIVNGMDRGASG